MARGMDLEVKVFSHVLASSRSWSDDPFVEASRRNPGVLTQRVNSPIGRGLEGETERKEKEKKKQKGRRKRVMLTVS